MDLAKTLAEIDQKLIPHYELNTHEQSLYILIFNRTRVKDLEYITISIATIAEALNCSVDLARTTIRSLTNKGCIEVERTRKGHFVKALLPTELNILTLDDEEREVDIEEVDFFTDRKYVNQILERENSMCFYCLSEINVSNCELEHVVSRANGGGNNYRNIVASCHKCNTRKLGTKAEDYMRVIYRKHILNDGEFEQRIDALEALKGGKLKPIL